MPHVISGDVLIAASDREEERRSGHRRHNKAKLTHCPLQKWLDLLSRKYYALSLLHPSERQAWCLPISRKES